MASSATRPTFTFQLSLSPPTKHLQLTYPILIQKTHKISPFPKLHFVSKSIDVSKEDKPIIPEQEQPNSPTETVSVSDDDMGIGTETDIFVNRRLEEKFVVLNTGIHECRSCGYLYNQATGDPSYPIPAGLPFDKLPEDWRCATCGAAKTFFESKSVEIAGFAQNQQFGLGGNTLTSGQKALLIYGSLLFFFALFLSGYFIQ